jgi:hypothetical protein
MAWGMRCLALLLAVGSSLGLGASSVESATCDHHAPSAFMPSKCPFVNGNTGFGCIGFVSPNGFSMAGYKYKCSRGHQWIVSTR